MKLSWPYHHPSESIRRFAAWGRKVKLGRKLTFLLVIATIISGIATYGAITQSSNPFGPDPRSVIGLALTDLTLLLALMVIITRRLVKLWAERRKGSVGSRLQTRIVLMFLLVSMIPTIIVAGFSTLFFNYGIQSWFDKRVNTALEESVAVAEAYLAEHKNLISADVWSMAAELNRKSYLMGNPNAYNELVRSEARERYLTDAIVFQNNKILAKTNFSSSLTFEMLPVGAIKKAAEGKVVVLTGEGEDEDLVRALIKLEGFVNPYRLDYTDTYLLVGRFVDSKVLAHLEKTRGAATEYRRLQSNISETQIKFSFVFMLVALMLLLVAAWVGIMFAMAIARPIGTMVFATQRVKMGDLTARVEEGKNDEIGALARAFNRMTEQLDRQRSELINANHQIDARRHFIETVLSGVSAGVIALDSQKNISLFNRSATQLLHLEPEHLYNQKFTTLIPEMAEMLAESALRPNKPIDGQITLVQENNKLTLLVRIAAEQLSREIVGYVVTFDDITELLSAQRRAAWSDVARRIAHEIKNPLTPIHLAAERLKRKYAAEVSETENFNKYTDTIVRNVVSIEKMVEEFASFARMPAPVFVASDLVDIVRSTVFTRQCAEKPGIHYAISLPKGVQSFLCDETQIARAVGNLIKNAEEAIEQALQSEDYAEQQGTIYISLEAQENNYIITIQDTGLGFPGNLMDRLTEPYVTTRSKGTGLGLAIVKKIIEDHNGILELMNNKTGACARIIFSTQTIKDKKTMLSSGTASLDDKITSEVMASV